MKLVPSLLAAAVGITLIGSAQGVHVDPGGRGQVLIYPYFTVQNGQQTLLSVTNTSSSAQAVKVSFHEGYNNRQILDFNLWLPAYDVWTGTIFALEDAALPGEGAAITTSDRSCTSPLFSTLGLPLNGNLYVPFVNFAYASANADGGPQTHSRTREGYVQIIAMTDVSAPLLSAITHNATTGIPADCLAVQPDNLIGTPAVSTRPSGGLIGAASIINVAEGTLLATRAEALAGFTNVALFSGTANLLPNLGSVNDAFLGGAATGHLFDNQGRALSLSYGGAGVTNSRPVDAVSAVLMADQIYNEYVISPNLNAGSDWLLTFPTKQFYVDPLFSGSQVGQAPFEATFNGTSLVESRGRRFDRESQPLISAGCCVGTPPPGYYDPGKVRLNWATNVLSFEPLEPSGSAVLASLLATEQIPFPEPATPPSDTGWMALNLDGSTDVQIPSHALPASTDGKVLRGLPVIGFWATNLVNNNVSNGVLSNYATAVPHATSVTCVTGSGATVTPCE